MSLEVNQNAPSFEIENANGELVKSSDIYKDNVIVYFYPKDNTPGCTTEAQDFTKLSNDFAALGYKIYGISPDSVKSHQSFIEKKGLSNITLLSDPENKVATAFSAHGEKKNYGKTYMGIIRSTFIINKGVIHIAKYNVKATGHAERILSDLKSELGK